MLGDIEVEDAPAVVASTTKTNRTRKRAVGTVKKSMETKVPDVIGQERARRLRRR